ncbi:MAG: hypothetical protein M1837_006267 [Sclerophora amabilis]|nr:MAG: hypothetical protein M1837_006267 [Sclerophora amabilis]
MSSSLGSVSDEWISPPRSASPASLPQAQSVGSDNSSTRSRIPRYQPPRRSNSAAQRKSTQILPAVSEQDDCDTAGILNEQTPSNINISAAPPKSHKNAPKRTTDDATGGRGRHVFRTVSSTTFQTARRQIVQQKSQSSSPPKNRCAQRTPEWRRRLLHGEMGYGDKKDLFSPTGLENIFRPPPPQGRPKTYAVQVSKFQIEVPSSPPLYETNAVPLELEPGSFKRREQRVEEWMEAFKGKKENFENVGANFSEMNVHPTRGVGNYTREESITSVAAAKLRKMGNESATDQTEKQVYVSYNIRTDNVDGKRTPPITAYRIETQAHGALSDESMSRPNDTTSCTARGHEELGNEEISPIFVSKHNTIDGRIDYVALDSPGKQLQDELKHSRLDDFVPEGNDLEPEVSSTTEEFASRGGFINVRRGGYSEEGSFRQRNLSPSSLPLPEDSVLDPGASFDEGTPQRLPEMRRAKSSTDVPSDAPPIAPSPPTTPRTPERSPAREDPTGGKSRNSGSPLKLFGTYDTFTNNKLLRRMSQFEDTIHGEDEGSDSSDLGRSRKHHATPEHGEVGILDTKNGQSHAVREDRGSPSGAGRFGQGQLDDHEFVEGYSIGSINIGNYDEDGENRPPFPELDPKSRTHFRFEVTPPPQSHDIGTSRRRLSRQPFSIRSSISVLQETVEDKQQTNQKHQSSSYRASRLANVESLDQNDELKSLDETKDDRKRQPHSPSKVRATKRRRTVNEDDLRSRPSGKFVAAAATDISQHQLQSLLGKKRKDALYDNLGEAADPEVLAMRRILRPRNPTPSQKYQKDEPSGMRDDAQAHCRESVKQVKPTKRTDDLQAPLPAAGTHTMTKALAALAIGKHSLDESRKGSVTTQDFYNEATKIMEFIRAKGRPGSGMSSVEESESEGYEHLRRESMGMSSLEEVAGDDQSTLDHFSRPPSREGQVTRQPTIFQQTDPRVLSHLEKFAEHNDKDGIISSSITMPSFSHGTVPFDARHGNAADEPKTESQPLNIRIIENPNVDLKRKHSNSSLPMGSTEHLLQQQQQQQQHHESKENSERSNQSSGHSSDRTIHSGNSDTKRVIAKEMVSHLIPEEVAGMTYDSVNQAWVKSRSASATIKGHAVAATSYENEEDPFENIPDLSVDERQELSRLREISPKKGSGELNHEGIVASDNFVQESDSHERQLSSRPQTQDGTVERSDNWSSTPSKFSHFGSSGRKIETRATSWGDDFRHTDVNQDHDYVVVQSGKRNEEADVKIQATEARSTEALNLDSCARDRRNLTIAFSSPLVSHVNQLVPQECGFNGEEIWSDASQLDLEDSGIDRFLELEQSVVSRSSVSRRSSIGFSLRNAAHGPSRRVSLVDRSFRGRPVSRIDEHNEEYASPSNPPSRGSRRISLDMALTTPMPLRDLPGSASMPPPPTTGRRSNVTFHLSPLPDFTIHEADEILALELSYMVKRRGDLSLRGAEASLSIATEELVKRLTDVEPYEPYWDYIQRVGLRRKSLITLYKLDEFCPRIEDLDASHNELGQVSGAPSSIRRLNVAWNYLSGLTAWGHLTNLQYLNVSGNQIDSLEGFRNLVHLRELTADDNEICSLDGIFELDGLMSLRMRRNRLTSVDFGEANLRNLTQLDLQGNQVVNISNLHILPELVHLNLNGNQLSRFAIDPSAPLKRLESLKLRSNRLDFLNVSPLPNLRALHLDRNHIRVIQGLSKTKRLDTLSMREQSFLETTQEQSTEADILPFDYYHEIRRLFLSGTCLSSSYRLNPTIFFLNLQSLQLASSGLSTLPAKFGRLLPNVRILNLNFNALSSLRPLLGIIRLKKLYAAGNRISRLRRTAAVLSRFDSLTKLDLRNNPLTLGFYPPITETRLVVHADGIETVDEDEGVTLDPFTLADVSDTEGVEKDEAYESRLDPETKLRRRVYEILLFIGLGCKSLRKLDGLHVSNKEMLRRDDTWSRLVEMGILKHGGDDSTTENKVDSGKGFTPKTPLNSPEGQHRNEVTESDQRSSDFRTEQQSEGTKVMV